MEHQAIFDAGTRCSEDQCVSRSGAFNTNHEAYMNAMAMPVPEGLFVVFLTSVAYDRQSTQIAEASSLHVLIRTTALRLRR